MLVKEIIARGAVFLFMALLPLAVTAQGRLIGKVIDQNRVPVVAAMVAISSQDLNEAAITNASGYYVFYSLPAGNYKVKVIKRGLPTIESDVAVTSGATRFMDIRLIPPQKEEIVVAEAPQKVPEKRKAEPKPAKKAEPKVTKPALPQTEEPEISNTPSAVTTASIDADVTDADAKKALSEARQMAEFEPGQYDTPPEIEGGMNRLYQKLIYPSLAREHGIEGNVVAKVFVDQNGLVSKVSLVRKSDEMFNDEVYRVLTEDVRFIPATHTNRSTAGTTTVFVSFSLQKNALALQVQAAVLARIFAEEKSLSQKSTLRVGIIYSSEEGKADAAGVQAGFSSVKIASKLLEEKVLRASANEFDILYLTNDANISIAEQVSESNRILTVSSNSKLVEGGFVSLAVTNDEQGRPKIFINRSRLAREGKSFSNSILKLSTVIE